MENCKNNFEKELTILKKCDFVEEILQNGWKPYLVGGCVRDYLMNKESNDIDIIVVGCDKNDLITLLKQYGKCDLVGESYAVIKFHFNGEVYDISTPRIEKKVADGHKGFDVISDENISLETDLLRRDLTINSIAMDLSGNLVDPFNGADDIKNKLIKMTNENAFSEDPLRILRSIRFAARFDFNIEKSTTELINTFKKDITFLSPERMFYEWCKCLSHATCGGDNIMVKYCELLTEFELWSIIFPKMIINENIKIQNLNNSIIFSHIFYDNDMQKMKKYLIRTLKFDSVLVNKIYFLIEFSKTYKNNNVYKLAKLKKQHHISDQLLLAYCDNCDAFIKYCNDGFVYNGLELISQGYKNNEIEKQKEHLENQRFVINYLNHVEK